MVHRLFGGLGENPKLIVFGMTPKTSNEGMQMMACFIDYMLFSLIEGWRTAPLTWPYHTRSSPKIFGKKLKRTSDLIEEWAPTCWPLILFEFCRWKFCLKKDKNWFWSFYLQLISLDDTSFFRLFRMNEFWKILRVGCIQLN